MIPFLDLKVVNAKYEAEFKNQFEEFIASGRYILGDEVKNFESEFANHCNANYAVGTGNGLDALILIWRALIHLGRLKKGDKVMVPANTYIASILSVKEAGLEPIFIEPQLNSFNIDPDEIRKHMDASVKAILVVHLYGRLANMSTISEIAKNHDLILVEDAAQAHGAKDEQGQMAGTFGIASGFSFYPTKNLGALGDAGCVLTSDKEIAETVGTIRNYGAVSKYINDLRGVNSRLDEIQAAFLRIKLKGLELENSRRRELAAYYTNHISNSKIQIPEYSSLTDHVYHQYVLRVENRDEFIEYLNGKGVGTLVHYPVPPHKQKALIEYNNLNLPKTEKIHQTVVSIPLNPSLSDTQAECIVEYLNTY